MIYGIGTDICDVRRIAASLERHGERFTKLMDKYLPDWRSRRDQLNEWGVRIRWAGRRPVGGWPLLVRR